MKRLFTTIVACLAVVCMMAQGWPQNYGGVMLQGFYWDYYDDTDWGTWTALEGQASDLEGYIDLIWVPNSARTKNDWCVENNQLKDMGYMPCWWLNHDNTIFGNTEQLKSMINTMKSKGIGIIEDVVINHKNGQNSWCDFPDETVTGSKGTYTLNWTLADICNNDNGGYVKTMFDITGANDTGDDFDGCRDLDHTGANVQANVKTYLDYLQQELGYTGFRYDMVKGYGPQYVGIYNAYAKPTFSVGEFWDNWDGTTWWINGTKQNGVVQSAAFDFPLKFLINNAFKGNSFNQSALADGQGLAGHGDYKRYSVTFVDNHDTYRDGTCMNNVHHVLAANAFILSMPGTPCIFLPHWKTHKDALKRMIAARKAAGITNTSSFTTDICNNGNGRQFTITGSNGVILLLLGDCGYTPSNETYTSVWESNSDNWNFRMFVSKSLESALGSRPSGSNANLGTPRVDMASGTYYQTVTVNVSASDAFTTLVYTEDGTDPTASSSTITVGGQSFIYNTTGTQTCTHTLKVGVKKGESVTDIQTYRYAITNEILTDIAIYVRADKSPIYLYAWDDNGTLTDGWPGTQLSAMRSANGQNFYYMTFPKASNDYKLKYILNQGSDGTKTNDSEYISSDVFTALGNANEAPIDLTNNYTGATIEDPIAYKDITVYVEANRYPAKLYAWNSGGELLGRFPGKQMNHTACINGKAWFYETVKVQKNQTPISIIVSDGSNQSADYTSVTGDVFVSYDGGDHTTLSNKTSDYAGYPLAWYEEGEICAFFVIPNGWTGDWYNIFASADDFTESGRGDACTFLGYNESGDQIWKWTCTKSVAGQPSTIVFNSEKGGNYHTEDLRFVNGAWYSAESYKGSGKTEPISIAVTPSTEISIASLGTPTTATNWDGKEENVAQKSNGETMSKDFSLTAGNYTIQAIVRGTENGKVTLSAKEMSDEVTLTGMDGAASSVQTNGIVEGYTTGTNNGWQKAELSFTLTSAEKVTVTLTADNTALEWQLGALKVLTGTTKTKATTSVGIDNTYVDVRGESDFSFFERGANRNALIKASAGTLPAQLPYNVIVDGTCANLKLTDGNFSFKNNEVFTAPNVSYDRFFTMGQRSTICLPFSLTKAEAEAAGTFWTLTSYDSESGNIRFEKVDEPVANTPYIFEAKVAQPFLSISGKTVPAGSFETVVEDGISFIGVNARQHLVSVNNGVTYYGYGQSEGSPAFVKVGTSNGAYINPFRAYLMTSTPLQSARMNVVFDGDDVTGIQQVTPTIEPMGQQPIYSLSGQRVETPLKKGIYIRGGKKFIVK